MISIFHFALSIVLDPPMKGRCECIQSLRNASESRY